METSRPDRDTWNGLGLINMGQSAGRTREPGIASGQRELGAMVEPKGQQAEAESRDTPATATLEDGRPAELAP